MTTVALFTSSFYPHLGGVEEHVRQLAHACRGRGFTPIILTNQWPRTLPAFEEHEGTPVYRLPMRVPDGSRKAHASYWLTHAAIRREMLAILDRHRVELIHVHCVSGNGLYARFAHRARRLPLLVTTHGERTMDATQLYQRSAWINELLRSLLSEADHVTACSQHTLDDMESYWGQPFGDRASVVYNGVALEDFISQAPALSPRPFFLAMGRLVQQKGFDVLLEAYARANPDCPELWIAGEGEERAALEALADRLCLGSRVRFLGRADRTMAVTLLQQCLFFVLPSRQEPMGIVNLEAMAAGKAVIASRVGGVPEVVVDGETGLLVAPEDADALARAIERLSADTALRGRLGQAGRRRAESFTWSASAERYAHIYELVAERAGTSRAGRTALVQAGVQE